MASGFFPYADPKHPCPEDQKTFNPDGSRIRPQTAQEKADEEAYYAKMRARFGDKVAPYHLDEGKVAERRANAAARSGDGEGVGGVEGAAREGGKDEDHHPEGKAKEKGVLRKAGRKVWDSFDEHKRGAKWGSYAWENR